MAVKYPGDGQGRVMEGNDVVQVSATSMRRSSERKVPAVSGGTLTSSVSMIAPCELLAFIHHARES